jgi:hypothetical protein
MSHTVSEFSMSAIDHSAVYDDLLDLLVESANGQRVLDFRLSDAKQVRLDELLERNREGTLTDDESAELDAYERFEPVVRLLKARVLQKRGL